MTTPLAIIAGVGPGVGLAVARRFAREGFTTALLARNQDALDGFAATIPDAFGHAVDLSDPVAVKAAIAAVMTAHGAPTVLVYNAAGWHQSDPLNLDPAVFTADLALCATGALAAIQAVQPAMAAAGSGSLIFTGGGLALYPHYGTDVISLTAGKSALRSLVLALAPRLAEHGLHAATVTVTGTVAPGTAFDPDRIAEHYWTLHAQAKPDWQTEIVFDGKL